MELQDAPATYLFKLWPWFEANKIRIACGGGIVVVAIGVISFISWQRVQKEITAGEAFTGLMMSDSRKATLEDQAGLFMKVAGEYSGTTAGQRALVQSAGMLFEAGKYPGAQAQFQQFLKQYPGSSLASQAALGVAASLDAQGQTDSAAAAYQRVISGYSDAIAASYAKYRLGQIDERLGKTTEALKLYEDIARSNAGSQLGSEAGLRAMELNMKSVSAAPAIAPAASVSPAAKP
jgi:predicted negative regulator of RcsB-dependent stress response